MTVTAEIGTGQLAELVKQVQAGNEVLLTQGDKPVAKLVPAFKESVPKSAALRIRSLQGHQVLTPVITQDELAEEMFGRQRSVWIATSLFTWLLPITPRTLGQLRLFKPKGDEARNWFFLLWW